MRRTYDYTTDEVFTAIQSERDYQDERWELDDHSLEEWLVYIEDYVDEAKHILTRGEGEEAQQKALEALRKVAALAVAAMEQNGAPQREGYERGQQVLTCPECSADLFVEEGELVPYEEEECDCDECECEGETEEDDDTQ